MAWGYWSATSVLPDRRSPRRGTTLGQQPPVSAPPAPALPQAQTAPCSSSSSSSADGALGGALGGVLATAAGGAMAGAAPGVSEPIRAARRPSLDLYGGQLGDHLEEHEQRQPGPQLCSSAPHAHQMQQPPAPQYRWAASTTAVHLDDHHDELVINHSYCPRLDHRHGPGPGHQPYPGHQAHPGHPVHQPHQPQPQHVHHHYHSQPRYQDRGERFVQYHRADLELSDDEEEPGYASGECPAPYRAVPTNDRRPPATGSTSCPPPARRQHWQY